MKTNVPTEIEKKEVRIEIVANRIFAYYLQIIEWKKTTEEKSFIIDHILSQDSTDCSLGHLEDKYDSKSTWRNDIGILNTDAWNTIGSEEVAPFRDMGLDENEQYFINHEKVLRKASLLLSKNGVANYFEAPQRSNYKNDEEYGYDKWLIKENLIIVL